MFCLVIGGSRLLHHPRERSISCVMLDCYRYYHCGIDNLRFALLPVMYISMYVKTSTFVWKWNWNWNWNWNWSGVGIGIGIGIVY